MQLCRFSIFYDTISNNSISSGSILPTQEDVQALTAFIDTPVERALLGLVYGRRRIGKSTLLVAQSRTREGFYFEATRVETPVQLERLGSALGEHLGVGRLAFGDWGEALDRLLRLSTTDYPMIVLDEFGHVLEADRSVESVLAKALGPGSSAGRSNIRLVLCGSAISMMQALTAGQAPLRGRAGLELLMQPDDFRTAATRLPNPKDLALAVAVFSVIGGVVGYATEMTNFDLPTSIKDFDRWVTERVLSPAAPLHYEATTLLAEDPTLAGTSTLLHHGILGAIANGSVTAGTIADKVGRQVSNLAPSLNRLVDAGFVVRHNDPLRKQRALYALADPYLQFHYAVLEPHRSSLRGRQRLETWRGRLVDTFGARVRDPVFEEMAREWVRNYADTATLGGIPHHVGPSGVVVEGKDAELDVVVASEGESPGVRPVLAIGEAKAGETIGGRHLSRLERVRAALGSRAVNARLLLFGVTFTDALTDKALQREDVELIGLKRLYQGQ